MRSVANSRVRCAIVIESELAITNAPTKSAMPPKASRNVCRMLRKLFVSSESLSACVSPLFTCAPNGRMGSICETSSSGETPGLAATRIWSSFPTLPKSRCAVGRSNPARVAPPIVSTAPNLTRPEMRNVSTAPSACTPISWPAARSFFDAVAVSTTTSPSFGHAPLTSVSELNSGCVGSTLKPRFGAPPKTIALPFSPISWASPPTPPSAALTPGSASTSASTDSEKGGGNVVPL